MGIRLGVALALEINFERVVIFNHVESSCIGNGISPHLFLK